MSAFSYSGGTDNPVIVQNALLSVGIIWCKKLYQQGILLDLGFRINRWLIIQLFLIQSVAIIVCIDRK